jgi:hypothetical protein
MFAKRQIFEDSEDSEGAVLLRTFAKFWRLAAPETMRLIMRAPPTGRNAC